MAQRDIGSFKATKNSRYAANTSGSISAQNSQDMFEDTADSFLNISDHFIDEDSFATNSASKVPSQQSVKAYVDAQAARGGSELYSYFFTDFETVSFSNHTTGTFNNGGGLGSVSTISTFGVGTAENAFGVYDVSTSTSTAGGASIARGSQLTFGFGYTFQVEFRMALSALSDGTDTYTAYAGFNDVTNGDGTDGAYFRYTHGTNGGRWEAVTRSNSVETAADTGVAADAGTYHIFKIIANAAGTQIDFYIDGVLKNSITTNIPSDAARLTNNTYVIKKTAGSTSRSLYMDFASYIATRTTAR
jgi:hypothetical protein